MVTYKTFLNVKYNFTNNTVIQTRAVLLHELIVSGLCRLDAENALALRLDDLLDGLRHCWAVLLHEKLKPGQTKVKARILSVHLQSTFDRLQHQQRFV